MRTYVFGVLAGLVLACTASVSQAQGFVYRNYAVVPTPYPGNFSYYNYNTSPYGYQSFYSTGVYPTPFGYNAYQYNNTFIRPYYAGPYHSIIFDPAANTYRYAPGYASTPNYYY